MHDSSNEEEGKFMLARVFSECVAGSVIGGRSKAEHHSVREQGEEAVVYTGEAEEWSGGWL